MKKVLLTGANGYIGQFAVDFLQRKSYVVHAVTSKEPKFENAENLIWHKANLLDYSETKNLIESVQPTHILHFAWYVEHGKFWNAIENLDWLNASLSLAKLFAENGGGRFVMSGTCAEYDWSEEKEFSEFESKFKPQTLYGAAKYSAALTIEKLAELSNFSFASGKIFFPFGHDESANRLIPSVIRALLEDRLAETSHGNQIRDFLFVENVAEAFVELLESDVGGAVNIASGKGVKLREIIELIGEITGKTELLRIGAIPVSPTEPEKIVADVARLENEVGYKTKTNLRKHIEATVSWWKNNL